MAASPDLLRAHGLQRVGYEIVDQAEEPPYVRQYRMGVECPLVDPFRVNEVEQRLARLFVEMDSHAAGLGARGLQNAHQLVTHL